MINFFKKGPRWNHQFDITFGYFLQHELFKIILPYFKKEGRESTHLKLAFNVVTYYFLPLPTVAYMRMLFHQKLLVLNLYL